MDFNRNNGPSVTTNPLPNHVGPNVNAIVEDSGLKVKTKMDEVKSSMEKVYKVLVKIWVILEKVVFYKRERRKRLLLSLPCNTY